jgi:hypothetical protein
MKSVGRTFGMADTLPPLGSADLRARLWLAFTGVLLLTVSFFPSLARSPVVAFMILACWLALPAKGALQRFFKRGSGRVREEPPRNIAEKLYAAIVVTSGICFVVWARQLQLSWPVTLGALLFIEAIGSLVAALTEWWRLSNAGFSLTLITCGMGFPFVPWPRIGMLFGAAIIAGSLFSAAILRWQIRRRQAMMPHDEASD